MNLKRRRNTAKLVNKPVTTTGEVFPDGVMVELVSGSVGSNKPRLLLWNGTAATIASQVEHSGCTFQAAELSPSIYRAIRLPSGLSDSRPVRVLFTEIAVLFNQHLHFSDCESRLLASFCMSTWLADLLPIAPGLVVYGPDQGAGIEVLRLLSCLCRRPLLLAEVTPNAFRSLPMHLSLTLLINQHGLGQAMQRLFRASSYRGLLLPGKAGTVVDLYGPKAIFCESDVHVDSFNEGMIQISITPSQVESSAIDENVQTRIANDFQPQLLRYRLKNHSNVSDSRVDVRDFTSATRQLARALASCLSEDLDLARETVRLLRPQEEDVRERRRLDVRCVVIEILWGLVHNGKEKKVTVDELAKLANALLRSRGETLAYSAEEIGWKLRELGVPRHNASVGRQVVFDGNTRQNVHNLARVYNLQGLQRTQPGCSECTTTESIIAE